MLPRAILKHLKHIPLQQIAEETNRSEDELRMNVTNQASPVALAPGFFKPDKSHGTKELNREEPSAGIARNH